MVSRHTTGRKFLLLVSPLGEGRRQVKPHFYIIYGVDGLRQIARQHFDDTTKTAFFLLVLEWLALDPKFSCVTQYTPTQEGFITGKFFALSAVANSAFTCATISSANVALFMPISSS